MTIDIGQSLAGESTTPDQTEGEMQTANSIEDRAYILKLLREELVGPSPQGQSVDCSVPLQFDKREEAYGPFVQQDTGEEIINLSRPMLRYGIGVLFPPKDSTGSKAPDLTPQGGPDLMDEEDAPLPAGDINLDLMNVDMIAAPVGAGSGQADVAADILSPEAVKNLQDIEDRPYQADDLEEGELDLSSAYIKRPTTMGLSLLAYLPPGSTVTLTARGGRYEPVQVWIEGKPRKWWLRKPVELHARFSAEAVLAASGKVQPESVTKHDTGKLQLELELYSRPGSVYMARAPRGAGGLREDIAVADDRVRLLTACVVNRASDRAGDEYTLFQAELEVSVESAGSAEAENGSDIRPAEAGRTARILPFPFMPASEMDEEEESLALLYRRFPLYAVGHGCSVDWDASSAHDMHNHNHDPIVRVVRTQSLPVYEVPGITSDALRPDGTVLEVPMAALADLLPDDDGFTSLEEVVGLYENWIGERRAEIPGLPEQLQAVAQRHMQICEQAVRRMRAGLDYLRTDRLALRAFRLANHAMLLQQICSKRPLRNTKFNPDTGRYEFSAQYEEPDPLHPAPGSGKWRAFQIAFALMTIRSVGEENDPDRDHVELIWFPTGGGKTEAYLLLAAFAIFLRRLRNPSDAGVHVLMRYTLRLLTAQQFQRASVLLCAMEILRRTVASGDLGRTPLSIGIWLGSATTPNTGKDAQSALKKLQEGGHGMQNPLLVTRCPWCGARMGPLDPPDSPQSAAGGNGRTGRGRSRASDRSPQSALARVAGYYQSGSTVVFRCPDSQCPFSRDHSLPVYVIDEDIYRERPALVIGTVDKFAMLAWKPDARALFGIAPDGNRTGSPPGLILQDELHLISGPLGSMVGLYESLIEELCTDRRKQPPGRPKIICSTATTRHYVEQVRALYARRQVSLFPPPGLDAGDSFFARYAREPDGTPSPGRLYVGVFAPALGSLQEAQVRVLSVLLQAPCDLPPERRDPWWTPVVFHNSLRELGGTRTLLQALIPVYTLVLLNRMGKSKDDARRLWSILELTGRIQAEEVPRAITQLEITYRDAVAPDERSQQPMPVDICLTSNIMEAGVDIDRLSLMVVVGQPISTTRYIQITGRVGRRWKERPGLVVTVYNPSRARDRSHYEMFRTYHERLYAQVEPSSVTPFSPPALERALHAVLAAYVRQAGGKEQADSPYPFPHSLIDYFGKLLKERVRSVDPGELPVLDAVMERRVEEWRSWEKRLWKATQQDVDQGLLVEADSHLAAEQEIMWWPTPTSLRSVDAECEAVITRLYAYNREHGQSAYYSDWDEQEEHSVEEGSGDADA